ncbi:DUF6908 domain-containing protein [Cupriavidus pinatubonensis]|uniref:DUF6908 domain-containing protein n=1 Tax=Cupriavidus pinatubonensis TaxID=248026 RepID=A0ABM8WQS8_9BURK|nr:hypothetical protein [Cupriavidus pinatubonensis]CAG9169791.1 hypothetical protein LMG23994_01665 [Cupriavidus pinatubonensis]
MPTWVDLTEHEAALNVQQTQEGKVLLLRSLSGRPLPESITALGFEKRGDHYVRDTLRFTLQEIQRHFPRARSRDLAMPEIFYVAPAPAALEATAESIPTTTEKAPWQMTAAEWNQARGELRVIAGRVTASSETARIGRLAELGYGVAQWRHERALAGDTEARESLEEPITHLDVLKKALFEGMPVPFEVVAEYPELLEAADVPSAEAPRQADAESAQPTSPATEAVATTAVVRSARKRAGTERVIRAPEVERFGRRGFVSEYFVVFEDGRFPTAVEALDREQAIAFAKAERSKLEQRQPAQNGDIGATTEPRAAYDDGRSIPTAGDEVFDFRGGFGGSPVLVRGHVVARGGELRVRISGTAGMFGEQARQGLVPLTEAWTKAGEEHPYQRKMRQTKERADQDAEAFLADREKLQSDVRLSKAAGQLHLDDTHPEPGTPVEDIATGARAVVAGYHDFGAGPEPLLRFDREDFERTTGNAESRSRYRILRAEPQPWEVPLPRFLAEARHEKDEAENPLVVWRALKIPTSVKNPDAALRAVHREQVSAAYAAGKAVSFAVLMDHPEICYGVGDRAARNVSKLIGQLGIAEKLAQGESSHVTLLNPPYSDLVIERLPSPDGDRLYFTHYLEANGDRFLDSEMVFAIKPAGHLVLAETAVQNPIRGGELRGRDVSFANMFSKNLVDQGFTQAKVKWPAEDATLDAVDATTPTEAEQLVSTAAEAFPGGVPEAVAARVRFALDRLREIKLDVDRAVDLERKVGMAGRYQADTFLNRGKDIESAQAMLAEFRSLAPRNGVDAEAFIATEGGMPDLTPSPEAQAWLDDPRGPVLGSRQSPSALTVATIAARLPDTAPQRIPLYGINVAYEAERYGLPRDFYAETSYNGHSFFAPADAYRTDEFTSAERALYDAHKAGDKDAVHRHQDVMNVQMGQIVRHARASMPDSELATAGLRVGDRIRFTPQSDAQARSVEGTLAERIRSSSGNVGFEVMEDTPDAAGDKRTTRVWAAAGKLELLPMPGEAEAFAAAREEAMRTHDNPHRIEALIRGFAASRGHVMRGTWSDRFTFNIAVPEGQQELIALIEKHLPSLVEMRNTLQIDRLSDLETRSTDFGKLAEQQSDAIRNFKAGFARITQPRIDDILALAPASASAFEALEQYGAAIAEAESEQQRYEQKYAAQQAAEEQEKWAKFEPYAPGHVAKPPASKIGFTKTWAGHDQAWFQVRNGDDAAWTNGHIFDVGEPHYAGFSKHQSAKYNGTPLAQRPDIARYLAVETAEPIAPAFVQRELLKDRDAVLFSRANGEIVGLDKLYYEYIVSKHPKVSFFIAPGWSREAGGVGSIIHAKVGDQIVAGVMPMRIEALTAAQIREKIEFYRPADRPDEKLDVSDAPDVLRWEFASRQRVSGRPAATATIKVMQVDGYWYSAFDCTHNQGNHSGQLSPLSTHGDNHESEFAARFAAGNRLVETQRSLLSRHADSMMTDRQRSAAREMAVWALQTILPTHQVDAVNSGPYAGWKQAKVTEGEYRGMIGVGADNDDAIEDLRQRLEYRLSDGLRQWREIGVNRDGLSIEEDALGVRALVNGRSRSSENVVVTPFGPRLALERRSLDYLTVAELQVLRQETEAVVNPEKASAEPNHVADFFAVGDVVAGAEVSAIVDGIPVSLFRRKLSSYDPRKISGAKQCTFARAYINGEWRSLGDPWQQVRPSNAELATAIQYAQANPSTFDGDAMLRELSAEIDQENAGIENPKHRLTPIPTEILKVSQLDENSFELRFRDASQPFSVLVEYVSPGIYVPAHRQGGTGAKTSLRNAMSWAARELVGAKASYERSLAEQSRDLPRFETDTESFRELFGNPRDAASTVADVRAQFPEPSADTVTSKFGRQDTMKIPADLVLTWVDERTINVSIDDTEHRIEAQIRCHEGRLDADGRSRWTATGALGRAIGVVETELAWSRTKAARPDGGASLDDIASRYAEFMRGHAPERHNGMVGRMHREFALALVDKDYNHFIGWLARPKGQNDLSKKFFTQATGIKLPKTARDITTALYAWAGYDANEAARLETEKTQRREAALQEREAQRAIENATYALESSKVNHNGVVKTAKAFIDEIIDAGYNSLQTRKRGAVDRYRLVNQGDGRLYEIQGNMVDYARHVLKQRDDARFAQELQDDEPQLAPGL